jgi:hypothetical protein
VAELTGRTRRVVRSTSEFGKKPSYFIEKRASTEENAKATNMQEKEAFMRGDKMVAIISDAASTGISMHADPRVKNQCQRVRDLSLIQ